MNVIDSIAMDQLKKDLPRYDIGDTLKVHIEVREGDKVRVQVFQGILIKRKNSGIRETITVRKNSSGVGVERVIPIHSPKIQKVEVIRKGRVRRAKLYYLRELSGKAARIREKKTFNVEASKEA